MPAPPETTAPLLRATDVSRRDPVSGRPLLHPYSLDVFAGDSIVLTGATGSGKSLLLRSLALIDPLDGGEIVFRGAPVRPADIPAYRAQVAYLRQRPAMLEDSVEMNLRLPFSLAAHAGRQYDAGAIRRLLDAVRQPPSFLNRLARDLSGGETQLVALLRVLQLDPLILLLDEPTAALDRDATGAVEALLAAWSASGPTLRALIMVTHAAEQAQRVGRRRLHIADGKLEAGTGPVMTAIQNGAATP